MKASILYLLLSLTLLNGSSMCVVAQETISTRLKADYGPSLDEWVETLMRCHQASR